MMATMDANVELVFGDDDRVQAFAVSKDAQGREFARVALALVQTEPDEELDETDEEPEQTSGDQVSTGTSPVVDSEPVQELENGTDEVPDKRVQKYAANKKRVLENAG